VVPAAGADSCRLAQAAQGPPRGIGVAAGWWLIWASDLERASPGYPVVRAVSLGKAYRLAATEERKMSAEGGVDSAIVAAYAVYQLVGMFSKSLKICMKSKKGLLCK
jgi:hypothetical protein